MKLPVSLIYGNPDQPRKTFEPTALEELAASIRENGLKQPITVRPDGQGRYMVVMGERRLRAHQVAGIDEIECHISEADDAQVAIDAIIENDQRVDVAPLEQAHAYARAMKLHGWTVEEFAKKVGKPVWRIEERTNLLKLAPEVQTLLKGGQITSGHAWYLVQLPPRKQTMLVRAIASGQCQTTTHLKHMFETIRDMDAQDALFEMEEDVPAEVRRAARDFEARLESVAALLRGAIDDNKVKAVRRVNPGRAGTIADLCAAMKVDLTRLETAFRVAAGLSAAGECEDA
jgi:ParB family chromosome partitioning protein